MKMESEQRPGVGSTLVLVECYGCDIAIAGNPQELHKTMALIIHDAGLTARKESLDVWEGPTSGPATTFRTLAESHAVASSAQVSSAHVHNRVRAESWTEPQHGRYVSADFQVCNYNTVNTHIPRQMAEQFIERLGAERVELTVFQRGPGCPQRVLEGPIVIKRQQAA